ncbi:hypothetical protein F183_A08270 [Bryobacterales bacterium F-183]|nr:hypothetical protein F183_A08270 [Bryobacterales bacterium F-183]
MNGMLRLLTAGTFAAALASADTITLVGNAAAKAVTHGLSRALVAAPVPEPSAFVVLGLGVALAAGFRRHRRTPQA